MQDLLNKRLRDAHGACLSIEGFIANKSLENYNADYGLRLQIERLLEIVGEALRRAEEYESALEQQIPEIRSAIGMRNRVIHGYDGIDSELIWLTATARVPELRMRIEAVLGLK